MSRTTRSMTIFSILCAIMCLSVIASQSEADLESKIERIFLKEHGFEMSEIEDLGSRSAIRGVLLEMVSKHRDAEPDPAPTAREFLFLNRAVFVLGKLKDEKDLQLLSNLLADREIHENVRYRAAQALGEIDADGSKDVLLQSLDPDNPDYITVRMAVIEALGKSHDSAVIASLRRYLESEKDQHLKQLASKSIHKIRSRTQ